MKFSFDEISKLVKEMKLGKIANLSGLVTEMFEVSDYVDISSENFPKNVFCMKNI